MVVKGAATHLRGSTLAHGGSTYRPCRLKTTHPDIAQSEDQRARAWQGFGQVGIPRCQCSTDKLRKNKWNNGRCCHSFLRLPGFKPASEFFPNARKDAVVEECLASVSGGRWKLHADLLEGRRSHAIWCRNMQQKYLPSTVVCLGSFQFHFVQSRNSEQHETLPCVEIRPHRRCWGVIFRMALVKGYRFTWGGGAFFGQNLLFLIGRDARLHCKKQYGRHLFVNAPVQNRQAKSEKTLCFSTFWPQEFLDPFSDWFSSFCDSRNTGFYSVFLFSACLTASFKTSKNLVNYAVLCYGVNENIVNTSVFWRWLKKHCKLQCFWPPDPQKPWYLQWFLLLTAQKHCK